MVDKVLLGMELILGVELLEFEQQQFFCHSTSSLTTPSINTKYEETRLRLQLKVIENYNTKYEETRLRLHSKVIENYNTKYEETRLRLQLKVIENYDIKYEETRLRLQSKRIIIQAPPSVYVRPEFIKYIPQRPLFLPPGNNPTKIVYECHAPGSRAWLGYPKPNIIMITPRFVKADIARSRPTLIKFMANDQEL
ncbi:19463_t:CDS:2 [Rhizophagus irregularis]|nr:19463_t:CDS:2 [Rhizophagus irregularis]